MEKSAEQRPLIYEFEHHASYLREMFLFRKKTKKVFSYAFAAARLDISVSYLKNVINRKHSLSLDLISSLGKLLELTAGELRYLTLLVVRDQIRDKSTRIYFNRILNSLRSHALYGFNEHYLSDKDNGVIFKNEFLHLIYSLVSLKDFRPDPAWIKSVLSNPNLSEKEIRERFEFLVKDGFVEAKNGQYYFSDNSIHQAGVFDPSTFSVHRIGLIQLDRSLEDDRYAPKLHTMFNLTVNDEDAERIRTIQYECNSRIVAIAEKSENCTQVLALSNNLFTLAKTNRSLNSEA